MYASMVAIVPLGGMGGDQLADSWLGEPGTVDTERFIGGDRSATKSEKDIINPLSYGICYETLI